MESAYGLQIPLSLAEACDPKRTALVVYDMQVGIVRQIPNGSEVVSRVRRLLESVREAGMRVFFMRHMSLPKEASGVSSLRMAMTWQRVSTVAEVKPWFLRDSPGFALVPEIEPRPSEVIFDKITMSAFEGTPLNIALRDCGIHSILIAGVATEIGIEPTVRHAVDLGYIPIVVADACGAGHAEAGERALASMKFMKDAILTDMQAVRGVLGRSTAA
jgi:nicotinamidase-related amidase